MKHVGRLQSRMKALVSLNIQNSNRFRLCIFKNERLMTSETSLNRQIIRPFVTGLRYSRLTHDDPKPAKDVPEDSESEVLPKYKEVVTSDTLILVLPDIASGTTLDEVRQLFSRYGTVEKSTVEEKSIQAFVLMKDRNNAVKIKRLLKNQFE